MRISFTCCACCMVQHETTRRRRLARGTTAGARGWDEATVRGDVVVR